MILRRSVPYAGGPTLLQGMEFQDTRQLVLDGFAAPDLQTAVGESHIRILSSWTTLGDTGQLTHLLSQANQSRLIIPLQGSLFCLTARLKGDPLPSIFRINPQEALWVPRTCAWGFYFLSRTIILTAATAPRNFLQHNPEDFGMDIKALCGHGGVPLTPLVDI